MSQAMKTTLLSAPSYFIIAGSRPGEGAVVTRDRDKSVDVYELDPDKNRRNLGVSRRDLAGNISVADLGAISSISRPYLGAGGSWCRRIMTVGRIRPPAITDAQARYTSRRIIARIAEI